MSKETRRWALRILSFGWLGVAVIALIRFVSFNDNTAPNIALYMIFAAVSFWASTRIK